MGAPPSEPPSDRSQRRLRAGIGLVGAVVVVGLVLSRKAPRPSVDAAPLPIASSVASARPAPLHKYSVPMSTLPPAEALAPGVLRVLVLGDSQARFLGTTLRHVQDDTRVYVAERGVGSCNVFAPTREPVDGGGWEESSSCSERWAADVAELRPDVTFVVMGGAFLTERACEPQFRADYTSRLAFLAAAMGPRAGRLVIARVPYPLGRWRYGNVMGQADCLNAILVDFARARSLPMVDLMAHVCPTRACRIDSEGAPIRPDGLHFDGRGAHETSRFVFAELERITGRADAGPR